jgi:hypothetical protein
MEFQAIFQAGRASYTKPFRHPKKNRLGASAVRPRDH